VTNVWHEIADRLPVYGLTLHSWTVCLFQPWIARQVPGCARMLPTGDVTDAVACPANPDVKAFMMALCADMAARFPLTMIQLEGITLPKFDYGWARPRILMDLAPWTTWLLGLCFCDSCCTRGDHRGIDVAGLRQRIMAEIEQSFAAEGDVDSAPELGVTKAEWLERDPDLREYLRSAEDAVVELVAGISNAIKAVAPQCGLSVWAPNDVDGTANADLSRLVDHISAINISRLNGLGLRLKGVKDTLQAIAPQVEITHFQPCSLPAFGWPNRIDSAEIQSEIQAATALPVDRISFYNFGLLRKGQLAALVRTTRDHIATGL
jgi:hypothetical protein